MSVRAHILFMLAATIAAWFAWFMVIMNVHPYQTAWWGFGIFYSTLFLAIFGSFTVAGYTIRSLFQHKRITMKYKVSTAMRQSFFWSIALVIVLGLQGQRLLNWWTLALVVIGFGMIEFFLSSLHQSSSKKA